MPRLNESAKAARTLREIFDAKVTVPGVSTRERNSALWLAITVLEGRAADEGVSENAKR